MLTIEGLLFAGLIFVLRVLNYAISTVRMVAISRQQRWLSASLAFLEAMIFAVVIANIVNDLDNLVNLMAYCLGAAAGGWVGMALESRFITSYMTVNIITSNKGHDIAMALRDKGYGVTETVGEGRDGPVTMLRSIVVSRDVPNVLKVSRAIDNSAFIAVEEARAIQRGWLRSGLHRRQNG
jgi:uncharacterized protein YebE (UPF0316 family)